MDEAAKKLITEQQIDRAARAIANARYPDIAYGLLSDESKMKYRAWASAALVAGSPV
jgi:hypothetical protein